MPISSLEFMCARNLVFFVRFRTGQAQLLQCFTTFATYRNNIDRLIDVVAKLERQ